MSSDAPAPAESSPLEVLAVCATEAIKLTVPHTFVLSTGQKFHYTVVAGLKPFDLSWDEVFLDHLYHYHAYVRKYVARYTEMAQDPEKCQEKLAEELKRRVAHLCRAYMEMQKVLCWLRYGYKIPAHFAALPSYCPQVTVHNFRYKFQVYHAKRPGSTWPMVFVRCVTLYVNGKPLTSNAEPPAGDNWCAAARSFRFLRRKMVANTVELVHPALPARFRNLERYLVAMHV